MNQCICGHEQIKHQDRRMGEDDSLKTYCFVSGCSCASFAPKPLGEIADNAAKKAVDDEAMRMFSKPEDRGEKSACCGAKIIENQSIAFPKGKVCAKCGEPAPQKEECQFADGYIVRSPNEIAAEHKHLEKSVRAAVLKKIEEEVLKLCWEIEKLPASEQQTKVVLMAGKIGKNEV